MAVNPYESPQVISFINMHQRRRPWYIWVCATMVLGPSIVLLIASISILATYTDQRTSPFAYMGAVLFPLPALGVLTLEYFAIIRRSRGASLVVGILFLLPLIPGSIALAQGVLGLLGILPPNREFPVWAEVGIFAAFLVYCASIGIGHLRWRKYLISSGEDAEP